VFTPHEEQVLRRLVETLRHVGAPRRSLIVSEALKRSAVEDGAPNLPARDAETIHVSRRISPAAAAAAAEPDEE
jgi:hypothetical protein